MLFPVVFQQVVVYSSVKNIRKSFKKNFVFSVRFLSLQSQRKRHGAKQTKECGSKGRVLKITKFLIPAKVAHLVEHDLAKVGVAGSSPVFRSNFL
jgi:hypothetical protein